MSYYVKKIDNLCEIDLRYMLEESKQDGFRFLERLVNDYHKSSNRFDKPGEALYGVFNKQGILLAIGGLNIDPFSNELKVGRLRRFYVLKDFRRFGIGGILVKNILSDAKYHFITIVLHTDTEEADKFYTSLGFVKTDKNPNSTHELNICM